MTDRDISSDETMRMGDGDTRRMAIVRYRLRSVAHRIVSDCERLLDEMDRPGRDIWRDAVGEALVAARRLLTLIERHLGGIRSTAAGDHVARLHDETREPRERIVRSMTTLLGLIPTDPEDELLLQDARAIRELAVGLSAMDSDDGMLPRSIVAARPSTPKGLPASTSPAAQSRPRLLVVDDEASLRRALSRLLGKLGYEVTVSENGREALEMAEKEPPDLVLSDITMPEMDGFELLRRLKANETTRNVPVIMVSGHDDVDSVVRCIEQGAEDHITKPYETVLLQARIRASLERKRMRDLELEYLRRVSHLTAAAEAVERQSYQAGSLGALSGEDDELGRLARVFDRMVSGLKSREDQLQSRLRELRGEIREARVGPRLSQSGPGESPFAPGDVLADRYEVIRELGKGGMGMVYLAQDRQLGEEVAVKVVRGELVGQDPNLIERLKSEIRLARRITHRNVVRAHDLGEWNGAYFLTMEYVKGITVGELLATRGRLPVESTLAIGTQLADALAVAHEQQIIHRDIKPHNLLVDEGGVLKVMDFGLARLTERTGELTQGGFVVGTPRYMSPEQLLGGDIDGRSDLFAAGIVLYECLTGCPPFDASSPMGVVVQILEGSHKTIRDLAPEVPPALAAIIEQLLQRDPKDRVASARELAERLGEIGGGS